MSDPYQITSEINAFLGSRVFKSQGELEELASAYANLCDEANARLRRCADFLRQRLRSEAIHHAEIEPDLLNLLGILDSVPAKDWGAICAEHGLETASALLSDIAQELNDAYNAEGSAAKLLKRLRLLSLYRASVRERLSVLRSLGSMDKANSTLDDDIKEFEKARLAEIASEAMQFYKQGDLARLRQIKAELCNEKWRIQVSPEIISSVTSLVNRIVYDRAIGELQKLLPEIHAAYGALAFEECLSLLHQWNRVIAEAGIPVPENLQSQIQPAVDWVNQAHREKEAETNFANACSRLAGAIEEITPAEDLRRMYREVRSFDRSIPAELEHDYQVRIEELELRRRRRVRLVLTCTVVAILAAGAGVGILIKQGIVRGQVDGFVGPFVAALEAKKLDNASEQWKNFSQTYPELASRADLIAHKKRLDGLLAQEAENQRKFRTILDAAQKEAGSDPMSEETIAHARKAIGEIKDLAALLAKGSEAKLEIIEFEGKVEDADRKRQQRIDEAFRKEIAALRGSPPFQFLNASAIASNPDRAEKCLAEVLDTLRQVDGHKASPSLKDAEIVPLRNFTREISLAIQREKKIRGQVQEELAELSNLKNYASSAADLTKALERFVAKYPTSSKAEPFKAAIKDKDAWQSIDEWEGLLWQWKRQFCPAKAEIPDRITALKAYMEKHKATSPFLEPIKSYVAYLEKAQVALDESNPYRKDFQKDALETPVMQFSCIRVVSDGRIYYLGKDAKPQPNSAGVIVPVQISPAEASKIKFKSPDEITGPEPSPQVKLVEELSQILEKSSASWETVGCDLIQAIMGNTEVNPILRRLLLEIVLTCQKDCGWGSEQETQEALAIVSSLPKDVAWMNPDDKAANEARRKVENALARIKSFAAVKQKIKERREAMFAMLTADSLGCRGILLRNERGEWQLESAQTPLKTGSRLGILVDVPGANVKTFRTIGRVADGKIKLTDTLLGSVPEGTMVFIRAAGQD